MKVDRERLAKILALTTSDFDGEALAAVRRANAILKEAGLTWHDALASQNVVNISIGTNAKAPGAFGMDPQDFTSQSCDDWLLPHLTDKVIIDAMFRAIYAKQPESPHDEFWNWVDSVHQYWLDRKRVTPEQYKALKRCHLRAVRTSAE